MYKRQAIYPNLPFDGEKDFTPVSNLAAVPNIMTINPKVQAKDMAEFIKLAKSQPGKLTYACLLYTSPLSPAPKNPCKITALAI